MMAKNYEYLAMVDENEDFVWVVVEVQTEQIIKTFYFPEDAKSLCHKLNKGYGFDGFTPSFFNLPFTVPSSDINEDFESYVT